MSDRRSFRFAKSDRWSFCGERSFRTGLSDPSSILGLNFNLDPIICGRPKNCWPRPKRPQVNPRQSQQSFASQLWSEKSTHAMIRLKFTSLSRLWTVCDLTFHTVLASHQSLYLDTQETLSIVMYFIKTHAADNSNMSIEGQKRFCEIKMLQKFLNWKPCMSLHNFAGAIDD